MSGIGNGLKGLNPRQVFVMIVFLGSSLSLLWSYLAELDIIVRSEGRIIPAGKSQIVQHLEGGIVNRILVKEGENVVSGQALMELADIAARTDLGQEKSKLASLRGKEARLTAEANGLSAIQFPEDLKDEAIRRSESDSFRARVSQLSEETRVLRDQREQKRGEINEISTRHANLINEIEVIRKQFSVLEGLQNIGAASQMEMLDSQSRVKRLESQIREAEAALPRLRAAMAETDSRMGEIAARFRADASAQLTEVRAELDKSAMEVETNADRLVRNVVRAPVDGFINRLTVNTVGAVIKPGEVLLEITPDDKRIVVETRVKPNDRANLTANLAARVRVGAFDYATFGTLAGKVAEVSADTLTTEQGQSYYRVTINAELGKQPQQQIRPGMTATADIVVGKRTVLNYLLSPLLRFRDNAFRDPR